jgi:hypothetical protein
MNEFLNRMLRAAKLDPHVYEEVEADKDLFGQSMLVVILASLASGLGNVAQGGAAGIVLMTLLALVSWFIWAYLTYIIGTKLLPTRDTEADYGQLLRTIGFSSSPGIIRVVGVIPGLTGIVFTVANIWMLVAMVIAVRQALDYESTLRAVGVCLIGWLIQAVLLGLVLAALA